MTTTDAIKILADFNKWRRGAEIPQPSPALIGEAIDVACSALTFERTWIEGGMNPEDAPPLPWMKPFESPEQHEPGGEPAVKTEAEYVVDEPIEAKISRATPTWAGKDADEHLREIRGQDVAQDWIPVVDGAGPKYNQRCRLAVKLLFGSIVTTDARFWPEKNQWCQQGSLQPVKGAPVAYLPIPDPRNYPN